MSLRAFIFSYFDIQRRSLEGQSKRFRATRRPRSRMTSGPIIALVDGEHHPAVVRDALDSLDRERGVAGVVFCGGEEKVGAAVLAAPEPHYGRPVDVGEPEAALRRLAGGGVGAGL